MGILMALLAALFWGIMPQFISRIGGKPIQHQMGTVMGAVIVLLTASAIMRPTISAAVWIGGIISGGLWCLGQFTQYKSFPLIGHSRAFVISNALNLIGNSLFGVIVFGEWPTAAVRVLGFGALAIIIIGAVIVSYSDTPQPGNMKKGIFLLIIAMIGMVTYSCAPRVVNADGADAMIPQLVGMVGVIFLMYAFEPKDVKLFSAGSFKSIPLGLLWGAANICLLYANKISGVSVGYTIGQFCIVVSTLISIFILHEKRSKKEMRHTVAGVVIVTAGCVLIGMTKM